MLHLSQDPEADKLLSEDPLALLIGMVLDQQVPLEWAFSGPAELKRRMNGTFDAVTIASMPADELAALFARKPALHRYPGSMATRVHALCALIVEHYGGRAERIWSPVPSADELIRRLRELPGFGEQKAKIFMALLGKQLGVRPEGWKRLSVPYGEPGSLRSVADIVDESSLIQVRAWKQAAKRASKEASTNSKTSKTSSSSKTSSTSKTSKLRTTTSKRSAASRSQTGSTRTKKDPATARSR
ncbi:MAG TPA: HhH-GPD-type base excision DNA repair protein [Acidimicrobiales bacterium]|nr:HhH-GPD-type base excision DNA repair protein [Acidimicrobiales bacterium]